MQKKYSHKLFEQSCTLITADEYVIEKNTFIFPKMYSYNHLRSKFDGRNILVDVLQEWCGTPAEQAQKRKEFADVSQNRKKNRWLGSKSEGIH